MPDDPLQPSPPPRGTLAVFRHPGFLMLWSGAFISNIGNWMENLAQGWAVVNYVREHGGDTKQAAFYAEILNFADFAPVLFLALLAGVISDRVNRRVWLLVLQSAALLLAAALAAVAFWGHATPGVVILITFLEGIVWALNGPVWLALIPSLVPRNEIEKATALNSVQFNMARLAGPALAGFVVAKTSIAMAFAINAVTFIPVIYAVLALPSMPPKERKTSSLRADLLSGLRYTWTHPGTRRLATMSVLFMFLAAPVQGLLAVMAQDVLHGTSQLYGFMLGAIGLGSVTGALTLGRIPSYYPRHHLIPLAMCCFCTTAVLYSFSTTPMLSLGLLLVCGFFWLMSLNPSNTANQLLATDENRGRVMSVMLLCNQGSMPLGHLFASLLTHFMGPPMVVRVMVGTLLLIMLVFLFLREPAIDNLPRRPVRKMSPLEHVWEAITARSHRPDIPSESSLQSPLPSPPNGNVATRDT